MRQNEKNDSNRSYNLPEQILINMQVHSFGEKTVNQPWNILVKRTSSTSTIWNKKFFARTFGEQTDSAFPLRNLLELLTVNNVYRFQALKYTHLWHKNLLPNVFFAMFSIALVFSMLIILETPPTKIYITLESDQTLGNKLCHVWLLFCGIIYQVL